MDRNRDSEQGNPCNNHIIQSRNKYIMENTMHIWPEEPVRQGGWITISTVIEIPGKERQKLWYSIPENQEASLSQNADPFVIGAINMIMQSGCDARIHGKVSPSLLCNLDEFQAIWSTWMPDLKKATIRVDHEVEPVFSPQRDESSVAFSGGVDSCFTAYSQMNGLVRPNPCRLTAGIMVQGFDIPLDQTDIFIAAQKKAQTLLSSLGLELIAIRTNYKELGMDWIHSFGAAAASCLALFSNRFKNGFISQGFTYNEFGLLHEGSNPLTDPLLSSDSFRIVPGGTDYDRATKIFAMRNWDEFLQHLRVCWQGPQMNRNCCECEKCMRNILTFRALGLGLPECFQKDVDDSVIESLRLGAGQLSEIRYGGLVHLATANEVQGNWTTILEEKLATIKHLQRTQDSKFWQGYRWLRRRAGKAIAPLRDRNR